MEFKMNIIFGLKYAENVEIARELIVDFIEKNTDINYIDKHNETILYALVYRAYYCLHFRGYEYYIMWLDLIKEVYEWTSKYYRDMRSTKTKKTAKEYAIEFGMYKIVEIMEK